MVDSSCIREWRVPDTAYMRPPEGVTTLPEADATLSVDKKKEKLKKLSEEYKKQLQKQWVRDVLEDERGGRLGRARIRRWDGRARRQRGARADTRGYVDDAARARGAFRRSTR